MKSLLKTSDKRRMELIELLIDLTDWIKIGDLAKQLKSSVRVIRDDLNFFKSTLDSINIETSHLGVRITLDQTSGIKKYYRTVLENSIHYQILELVFFNETLTINDLAKELFTSTSTIYRSIGEINEAFAENNCQLETKPCKFVGDEYYIRNFYRTYFKETGTPLEWNFPDHDEALLENIFDEIIKFMTKESTLDVDYLDFAFYEQIKLMVIVNIIRYENGNLVDSRNIESVLFKSVFQVLKAIVLPKSLKYIYDKPLTAEYVYQLFYPYFKKDMAFSEKALNKIREKNEVIDNGLTFLEGALTDISQNLNVSIELDQMIMVIYGSVFIEDDDPNNQHILYDRNRIFADVLKKNTNYLYEALFKAIVEFRLRIGRDLDPDKINSLIHIIFTNWENLLGDLYQKYQRIKVLVVSDGHFTHRKMIQNLLSFELKKSTEIMIYEGMKISEQTLEDYDCDIIVSTFKLPEFNNKETIIINSFPTLNDIEKVEALASKIMMGRISRKEYLK